MLELGQVRNALGLFWFQIMPVKVEKRGNEYCVIEPDGSSVKGGCHATRGEATDHMRAINANIDSKAFVFKDRTGTWNWLGIVSNNREDREKEVLTADSHRRFVDAIDTGLYSELLNKDAPDLWVWHVPVPIGYAETVAYDERGFLIAAGKGHQGPFYDSVFEGLAKAEKGSPGSIGMSHGMPYPFLEKTDGHSITGYMSDEFTFLPMEAAANVGTGMGAVTLKGMGAMALEISEHKRKWFTDTFGEDTVDEFDRILGEMGNAADKAGIPKKELNNMADSTENKENVVEEEVVDGAVDETPAVEDDNETAPEKNLKFETEEEDEKAHGADDEEEEDEEKKEVSYVTRKELQDVVQQIADGVATGSKELRKELSALVKSQKELQKSVSHVLKSDEQKIAEKAKDTPAASLSEMFAQSIVGHPNARIDYHKDRKEHMSGPEETPADQVIAHTGIPSIDKLIKEQQGAVIPAKNGQR